MDDLRQNGNIGAKLEKELLASGMSDLGELVKMGSLVAAQRLAACGSPVCRSKLCALEGAIRGVRWHHIPADERAALWLAFQEGVDEPQI
jgi:DNA transformation protein